MIRNNSYQIEKKFNMNVFWVLLLVLLNTIGNQGDPNHGLINLKTNQVPLPPYIVSMRDCAFCHICTGSIISTKWVLTSYDCRGVDHILHGLTEFENCKFIPVGEYISTLEVDSYKFKFPAALYKLCAWLPVPNEEGWKTRPKCKHESVKEAFAGNLKKLDLPTLSCFNFRRHEIGEVIGWSFDYSKRKMAMMKLVDVNIEEAFSGKNGTYLQEFCKVGLGSPLVVHDVIYGFYALCMNPLANILDDLAWMESTIKNNP